jgi:O-antigen/teichoic acid export membrane protein
MRLSGVKLFSRIANARDRLKSRPGFVAALRNIGWLSFDNLFRLSLTLIMGVWITRYLGPAQFGVLSYATAFVSITAAFANLGLQGLVVRDLVNAPTQAAVLLGSAFVLKLAASFMATVAGILIVLSANPNDSLTVSIVIILSLGIPFQSAAVVRFWFESRVQSKYAVYADNLTLLLICALKAGLILGEAPLIAFAWVTLLQGALAAIFLFSIYFWTTQGFIKWRPRFAQMATLLRSCWPLALSSIAILIYTRTDQIMLKAMLGNESVGIYSAALRLSEVWYMIPVIVMASVFPAVLRARSADRSLYHIRFQQVLSTLVLAALLIALLVTAAAPWIISTVYGSAFSASAGVLRIHMWTSLFVFLGVASTNWLVAEGLQVHSMWRTSIGAATNILANLYFIPRWGVEGAAAATLISQVIASYLYDAFPKETRAMFYMKTRALFLISLPSPLKLSTSLRN